VVVRRTLESKRFDRFVAQLSDYMGEGGWRPKRGSKRARRGERRARRQAVRLLDRRLERVERPGRRLQKLSARELHRLRIRVKQLRYAGEFLAPLYRTKRAHRYLKRLAAVQDEIGFVNDGLVAEGLVQKLVRSADEAERVEVTRAADAVVGWSDRGASAHRAAMRRAWKRFGEMPAFWRD